MNLLNLNLYPPPFDVMMGEGKEEEGGGGRGQDVKVVNVEGCP